MEQQTDESTSGTERWPRVGVLGVGTIAEALITGLCAWGDRRPEILLSPRNETTANRLAQRFSAVEVAAGNQQVLDGSEIVILAVRPQDAEAVLRPLRFRPEQEVLSLIATFSVARLAALLTPPVRAISRAIPLPPVAARQGPLALFTESPAILRLLDGLGQVIHVPQEEQLELISTVTSLMGTYFGMAGAVDRWLVSRGFEQEASRAFVAELFLLLAREAKKHPDASFAALTKDFSTPGGLNEQAWRELRALGWDSDLRAALDLVLDRIQGHATFDTTLPTARRA